MNTNLFKYSDKDLRTKFMNIIQTNHHMSLKTLVSLEEPIINNIRRQFNTQISIEEKFENESQVFNLKELNDLNSTNMCSIMQNPEESESIINNLLRPFETGINLFYNFQQIVVFKKADDEFYEYKLKIYEVS